MSGGVRIFVDAEIRGVYRDLEALGDGLELAVTAVLARGAQTIADASRPFVPVGPGPIPGAKNPNDLLPHVFETLRGEARGMTGVVVGYHPAAGLIEFGGTIAPSVEGGTRAAAFTSPGAIIRFKESAMTRKGADVALPAVEAELDRAIDALVSSHQLGG